MGEPVEKVKNRIREVIGGHLRHKISTSMIVSVRIVK